MERQRLGIAGGDWLQLLVKQPPGSQPGGQLLWEARQARQYRRVCVQQRVSLWLSWPELSPVWNKVAANVCLVNAARTVVVGQQAHKLVVRRLVGRWGHTIQDDTQYIIRHGFLRSGCKQGWA